VDGDDPNRWKIVLTTRGEYYEEWNMSITDLLEALFSKRLDTKLWKATTKKRVFKPSG
jgi:hypothetical protein